MRARIVHLLLRMPQNANQLAEALGVHYTTIVHHLGVLEKNGLVTSEGPRYGHVYEPSVMMRQAQPDLRKLLDRAVVPDGGES